MLKKAITYTNLFTDEEVTEEHYFHISKADLVEMEMEMHNLKYKAKDGTELTGMQAKLQQIVDSEDGKAIVAELKDIIRRSYGVKIGERFIKNDKVWQEFMGTEAFSQLLFELCTDAGAAGTFMNNVVPNNLAQEAQRIAQQSIAISEREEAEEAATNSAPTLAAVEDEPKPRVLTQQEVLEMDAGDLQSGLAEGRYTLS